MCGGLRAATKKVGWLVNWVMINGLMLAVGSTVRIGVCVSLSSSICDK